MSRFGFRSCAVPAVLTAIVLCPATLTAGDVAGFQSQAVAPAPEQADSSLRDVAFSSSQTVWAVGDRGVIWKSTDSGESWQFLATPPALARYSLRKVKFVTDRVGWIVGSTIAPVGATPTGVFLATRDGGASWSAPHEDWLPPLNDVHFFDLEQGLAVGASNSKYPTGVLRTRDGGKTWQPLAGDESPTWNSVVCVSPTEGFVVGQNGVAARINQDSLQFTNSGFRGLRSLHSVALDAAGHGWLVGDGGRLLRTNNSAVSWSPLADAISPQVGEFVDFEDLAHRGGQAWIAGSAGSGIWHSDDGGESWTVQSTGHSTPLHAIAFNDDSRGVAVGALGRICVTSNGGDSWRTVRNDQFRLACLALGTNLARTPLEFLTRWAQEDGYRCSVNLTVRRDVGPDSLSHVAAEQRLLHAVLAAGGSEAVADWRLPLAIPSLEQDQRKLLSEWSRLTDGRVVEQLLSHLVAELRIWQPSAILLEEPEESDAAALTIQQAVLEAVRLAADPAAFPEHQQLAGLSPWQVRKVILQRRSGLAGTASLGDADVLPRLGTTLDSAVSPARRALGIADYISSPRVHFQIVFRADEEVSERALLHDLNLPAGSPARRELATIKSPDLDKLVQQSQHRRQINSIAMNMMATPGQADQLIGQLGDILRPLSPDQAAEQLVELGRMYRAAANWTGAEAVAQYLIEKYPQHPAAAEAALWLVTYWSSAELNWQRSRTMQVTQSQSVPDALSPAAAQDRLQNAILQAGAPQGFGHERWGAPLSPPIQQTSAQGQPLLGNPNAVINAAGVGMTQSAAMQSQWREQAAGAIPKIRKLSPQLADDPRFQFVSAAFYRRHQQPKLADETYQSHMQAFGMSPWKLAARGEIYLLRPGPQSPKPVLYCKRAAAPPLLDGVLSDDCWANAAEIRLNSDEITDNYVGTKLPQGPRDINLEQRALVMLTYDAEYLYLAASVPIDPQLPGDGPQLPGRKHDANLDKFDRLSFHIDVDRDYATTYSFEVDQRGMTRDSCWGNAAFDPQWYCAAVRDAASWRIECAIPLKELLPPDNITLDTWGLGISRVKPGVGSESWTNSGANEAVPALFGLVRF